jgi:N-acetylglutamate synthase-like GNAT family acetyltransferase
MTNVRIIPYADRYEEDFRQLNREWLEQYHLLEAHDEAILNNPRETILNTGGVIFLAESDGLIVGTSALMKEHEGVYELVKMGVAKEYQGKGISRLLLNKCIEEARMLKAKKLILFSNHQLKNALALYEKYGFEYIEVEDSPFQTADIKMELYL